MRGTSASLLGVLGVWAAFAAAVPECRGSDKRAVDKIFESWLATQGGIGVLPQVSSYGIQETLTVNSMAENKVDIRLLRTRASHFRIEFTRRASETIVLGFDGDVIWQARPNFGFSLVKAVNNDPMIWENSLFIGLELVPANTAHYTRGPEQVDGVDCIVVGVDLIGAPQETCYFERKTMKLVRVVRPSMEGLKGSRTTIVDFGDYRPIGKLSIPYSLRVDDGKTVYTYLRTSIAINPPVDEGSFVLSTAQVQEANTVSDILARQVATLGSREAFARVHTRVTHMAVESPTTGMHCTQTVSLKAPNLVVVETQTPGIGWETRGYDGKSGWFSSEIEGNRPLKPAELSQLLYLTNINQLGQLASTCPFRRLLGRRLVNGRPADAVALSMAQGPAATFYFDKESGRLARIATSTGVPGVGSGSTIDFSDFRVVDGVEVPFLLTSETPVMKTVSKVESVQNNVNLEDSLFHQPKDE